MSCSDADLKAAVLGALRDATSLKLKIDERADRIIDALDNIGALYPAPGEPVRIEFDVPGALDRIEEPDDLPGVRIERNGAGTAIAIEIEQ